MIAVMNARSPQLLVTFALLSAAFLSVVFLPAQFVIGIALVSLMGYLGLTRPTIGLGFIAITIPVQEAIVLQFGPGQATLTRLALLPFVAGWLLRWVSRRAEIRLTAPIVAWFFVVSALVASFPAAIDRGAWSEEVYRWAVAFTLFVIACDTMKTSGSCRSVIMGSAIGIIICVLVGGWQVLTAAGPASFQKGGLTRVYALFGEPNPLSGYLEMTLPLLIALTLPWLLTAGKSDSLFSMKMMAALCLVAMFGLGTLFLTQSRGGYLGIFAGLTLVGLLSGRRARNLTLLCTVFISMMIVATPPGRVAADRFVASFSAVGGQEQVTVENWSVQERVAHWKAGLHMLDNHPWLGVGAGNFDKNFRANTEVWRFRIPRGHAHNNEIEMGAQSGYTGLIAYFVLLFTVGSRIVRGLRRQSPPASHALAVGALGVLVAVVVHGQFDYLHGLSLNLAFALALACAEPAASFTPDAPAR